MEPFIIFALLLAFLLGRTLTAGQARQDQPPVTVLIGQPQYQGGGFISALLGIVIFALIAFYLISNLSPGL